MNVSLFAASRSVYLFMAGATTILFACNNPAATTNKDSTDSVSHIDSAQHIAVPDTSKEVHDSTTAVPFVKHAEAVLAGTYPDTTVTGTVKFDAESSGKVKMVLEIMVPAKAGKSVAVHIHEHGDCGDMANMAHGHWNPTKMQHGKWGSASFHSGDIGNVKLDKKGKGTLTLETDLWTLGGGADRNILAKAIIVHGGVDDYTSQPAGNAGTRIGCGVIK